MVLTDVVDAHASFEPPGYCTVSQDEDGTSTGMFFFFFLFLYVVFVSDRVVLQTVATPIA